MILNKDHILVVCNKDYLQKEKLIKTTQCPIITQTWKKIDSCSVKYIQGNWVFKTRQ